MHLYCVKSPAKKTTSYFSLIRFFSQYSNFFSSKLIVSKTSVNEIASCYLH